MCSNLSKELRKKYGKRSFPVRKGDEVKIMRGKSKGKTGKISVVESAKYRVAIENVQRKKKDGTSYQRASSGKELSLTKRKTAAIIGSKHLSLPLKIMTGK